MAERCNLLVTLGKKVLSVRDLYTLMVREKLRSERDYYLPTSDALADYFLPIE